MVSPFQRRPFKPEACPLIIQMQQSKLLSVIKKAGALIEWCVSTFERKCSIFLETKEAGGWEMEKKESEQEEKSKRERGGI